MALRKEEISNQRISPKSAKIKLRKFRSAYLQGLEGTNKLQLSVNDTEFKKTETKGNISFRFFISSAGATESSIVMWRCWTSLVPRPCKLRRDLKLRSPLKRP
jgi:hypothetical protein